MLRLALRGLGRPVLVTDAMPPVGGSRCSFDLYGNNITVRNGSCVTEDGILAGTVLNMATAVKNCIRLLGIPLPDALRLASANPATVMGLEHVLGKFVCGHRADIVAFDPHDVTVLATWVAGTCYH
jgi:N-acetylglucosamine-6-phosphate deacetylase